LSEIYTKIKTLTSIDNSYLTKTGVTCTKGT